MRAQLLILQWLKKRLSSENVAWIVEKAALLSAGVPERLVFMTFSAATRYSGKIPLALTETELALAASISPGWRPTDWTTDEAARIFLLLALPATPASAALMDQIYHTADVGEAVAMQKALAILPAPDGHLARAREGLRNNIQAVFEAVSLRNPYPALHFDTLGWNQLVVKTVFLGLPVGEIANLESRMNPELSRMLDDLAQERWSAGRTFVPELWRCVGPYADARALGHLGKVLVEGKVAEKQAAALALNSCSDPLADTILNGYPDLAAQVRNGTLTWENFNHGT